MSLASDSDFSLMTLPFSFVEPNSCIFSLSENNQRYAKIHSLLQRLKTLRKECFGEKTETVGKIILIFKEIILAFPMEVDGLAGEAFLDSYIISAW